MFKSSSWLDIRRLTASASASARPVPTPLRSWRWRRSEQALFSST